MRGDGGVNGWVYGLWRVDYQRRGEADVRMSGPARGGGGRRCHPRRAGGDERFRLCRFAGESDGRRGLDHRRRAGRGEDRFACVGNGAGRLARGAGRSRRRPPRRPRRDRQADRRAHARRVRHAGDAVEPPGQRRGASVQSPLGHGARDRRIARLQGRRRDRGRRAVLRGTDRAAVAGVGCRGGMRGVADAGGDGKIAAPAV